MKLNEITETGFYKAINDDKPTFIFEVIPNEKYPLACSLKGFIDGLKYVLQEDNQ